MLNPVYIWINVTILLYFIPGHLQKPEDNTGFHRTHRSFPPDQRLPRSLVPPRYEIYSQLNYNDPVAISQRRRLAEVMKTRYKNFRRKLEKTTKDELESYKKKINYSYQPNSYSAKHKNQPILSSRSSKNYVDSNNLKQLRSAGEAPSKLRLGSFPLEDHLVLPHQQLRYESLKLSSLSDTADSIEIIGKSLLDKRLGPYAPAKYDPSIVVNFNLLKLSQPTNRRFPNFPHGAIYPGKTIILTSKQPIFGHISSRDVGQTNAPMNSVYVKNTNRKVKEEEMSVYISTSVLPKKKEVENYIQSTINTSEYGPHSKGNDPEAGVSPSEINFPEMPLEQLNLPQSVRDSLRKYLQPLLIALEPLTKSVPGLPGLDYPILGVVPYTNFYCSNMPWPGFYADTEARCQTWHACDIDGRQSTFLCPNGTVFNQALMVCDWWYNSDCLTAPFLYSLNERLFGNIQEPLVLPYRRITPELLDTIFV